MKSVCILLQRLVSPCLLVDLKLVLGLHSFAIREIFWECLEELGGRQMHLVTSPKANVLASRTHTYVKASSRGALLSKMV
jgi:hypothetical protein